MNCLSLNIRGIGVEEKVRWARKLKLLHKATFIGIQETQMNDYTDINVNGCWDSSDYDFEGVNATGRSGGLLSMESRVRHDLVTKQPQNFKEMGGKFPF